MIESRNFLHRLKGLAEGAQNLLFPEGGSCIVCSDSLQRGVSEIHRRLCRPCGERIDWVGDDICLQCGRDWNDYLAKVEIGARPPGICLDCQRRKTEALKWNRSAVRYSPLMRDWLTLYKYRGNERLGDLFGEMLYRKAVEIGRDPAGAGPIPGNGATQTPIPAATGPTRAATGPTRAATVAPTAFAAVTSVPISEERLRERGFNQAERIARYLAAKMKLPYIPMLRRLRHTNKQSKKSRNNRLNDLEGAFQFSSPADLPATPAAPAAPAILIVDDVYTTGTTIHLCAELIKEYIDADIVGLTWAR